MSQIEYRAINKNSSMVGDIGYVNNYQSSTDKQKKNLSHLFAKYNHDLNLKILFLVIFHCPWKESQ